MSDHSETEDYEVGYGKPPISGQFKKGVSGNPSGRPKKSADFGSKLLRELDSKLIINENGKRKVITKSEGIVKQLTNKSFSGHHPSTRLLIPLYLQVLEKKAEEERHAQYMANRKAEDLSDEELTAIIRAGQKESLTSSERPVVFGIGIDPDGYTRCAAADLDKDLTTS
jgi:hypothetical protein